MTALRRLGFQIVLAMLAGAALGYALHLAAGTPQTAARFAGYLTLITDLFLRLIKMIIAPLVLATLISGLAHMRAGTSVGRLGIRTMLWFIGAGLVSLLLGVAAVYLLQPGAAFTQAAQLQLAAAPAVEATPAFDARAFLLRIVPASIFEALANNDILQIVVFSLFCGTALAALGEKATPLVRAVDALVHLMLAITNRVMRVAPLAIFAAIGAVVTTQGPGILALYGQYIGSFYLALVLLWLLIIGAGSIVLGRSTITLLRAIREPALLSFATASSEAAYPKLLEQLSRVGIPRRVVGFVLPLGYSFNLDGSMMYLAFAMLFIAQAYGVDLTVGQQISMLLVLMVASKGLAGVPRASLVVIASTLPQFNLPEAGIVLLLGVDHFLDMGRTATNVIGNSVATAVMARWEGITIQAPDSTLPAALASQRLGA